MTQGLAYKGNHCARKRYTIEHQALDRFVACNCVADEFQLLRLDLRLAEDEFDKGVVGVEALCETGSFGLIQNNLFNEDSLHVAVGLGEEQLELFEPILATRIALKENKVVFVSGLHTVFLALHFFLDVSFRYAELHTFNY
jgi:hypothetical protein